MEQRHSVCGILFSTSNSFGWMLSSHSSFISEFLVKYACFLIFYRNYWKVPRLEKDLKEDHNFKHSLVGQGGVKKYVLVFKKKDVSLPLLKCKQLTINSWISKNAVLGIGDLLRSTPYLENLTIFHQERDLFAWDEDCDLSGDNSLSLPENTFNSSLQNLKHAEVSSNCCSCLRKADVTDLLSEFLKSLLEHAKNLEKVVIAPTHKGCNISKLIKNLFAFPGASNIAVFP